MSTKTMIRHVSILMLSFLVVGCVSGKYSPPAPSIGQALKEGIIIDATQSLAIRAYELATSNDDRKLHGVDHGLTVVVCNTDGVFSYESKRSCGDKLGFVTNEAVVDCIYPDGGREFTTYTICTSAGFGKIDAAYPLTHDQKIIKDSKQRQLTHSHYERFVN